MSYTDNTLSEVIKDLLKRADRETKKRLRELEEKMTQKQLAFCLFYIANNGNAAEAARNAGYSKKHAKEIGCENLTKPNLKEYIKIFTEIQDDRRVASAQEVLENLTGIMRGDIEVEVKKTVDSAEKGLTTISENVKPPHQARINAAKQLGQHLGLWDDKLIDLREATIEIKIDGEDYEGEHED